MDDRLRNLSLRKAEQLIRALGGSTSRKDGELFFRHPRFARLYRVNNRRHDAPRDLVSALGQVGGRA